MQPGERKTCGNASAFCQREHSARQHGHMIKPTETRWELWSFYQSAGRYLKVEHKKISALLPLIPNAEYTWFGQDLEKKKQKRETEAHGL